MSPVEYNSQYFKRYRSLLGFSRQDDAVCFLGAKDIAAPINLAYAKSLVARIRDIIGKYATVVRHAPTPSDLGAFSTRCIDEPFALIQKNELLPRLNNQGRRPEEVLFSWLRGYATAEFFVPALGNILRSGVFESIGEDDFTTPETFKRSPTADYATAINGQRVRLEIQSGFQKICDIKQHKVLEAWRSLREEATPSLCIHLDVFNGQCAFVRLDQIAEDDVNWVTRQQMEGQTVFQIDPNDFRWRIADAPPALHDLELSL